MVGGRFAPGPKIRRLPSRANYLWRLFGTGLSFFLFGAVGLVVWGVLYPPVSLFLGNGPVKRRRSRFMMYRLFRFYIALMRLLGVLDHQMHNVERLKRPGRLIIANHPTLLDVVFLISLTPNATCIVKPGLAANPFMFIPIRAMGYLYAKAPEALLESGARELQEGSSMIIFPQGTRTMQGQDAKFQRGAANLALKSGSKILPVFIECKPPTLSKHEKWYQIPPRKAIITLTVGDEIDPLQYLETASRAIAARRLTRHLEQYFDEIKTTKLDYDE